jgi:hypothetical protein
MKIGDRDSFLQTETVELFDDVTVTINGLPFGFQERMERELPSPVAPRRPLKDSNGDPVYKNKRKKIVRTEPDEDDPKYKAAVRETTWLQLSWTIYHGTKNDAALRWDAAPDEFDTHQKFYKAIADELEASDIGMGHVIRLSKEILRLSGLSDEQLEAAKESFLEVESAT